MFYAIGRLMYNKCFFTEVHLKFTSILPSPYFLPKPLSH